MYVSSIFLDRFGRQANLRVANLSNGLNIICGPLGTGKSTLVDFLRAMWSGFDSQLRDQYLPRGSRGFGGAISVQTALGRQTISRYDDGCPEGRLTVEREDGAVIGRRHVHDLIGNVPSTLLECAFLVNFQRRPRLEVLLAAATGHGCELTKRFDSSEQLRRVERLLAEKRQSLTELSSAKESLESLIQRRQKVLSKIDSTTSTTRQNPDEPVRNRQQLQESAAELQRRVTKVSSELESHDQTWNELDAQRRRNESHPAGTGRRPQDLPARLAIIDSQLARWNRTLRDVVSRKQRAAERSENRQRAVAVAAANATPRRHLLALKTRIQESQQSLEQISDQHSDCVCQKLQTAFADMLHAMQDDVQQLSNDLNCWQSYHLYRQATGERDQLARCELELRQTIHSLVERRQAVLCRIVDMNATKSCLPDLEAQDHCSNSLPTMPRDLATPSQSSHAQELALLNAELVRVDESRHKARRELQELAIELEGVRGELQKLEDSPSDSGAIIPDELPALAKLEKSIRDAEIRRDMLREIEKLEEKSRQLREESDSFDLVREASRYLRRLSSGKWSEIHVASPQKVSIEGAHERGMQYDDLDAGSRDQVYLALCLAVVTACDRNGFRIPLVLNAAFTHYPSKDVRNALEVLCDFARDRQVLCLTRYEHVVGLARMLNVPVYQLLNSEVAATCPDGAVVLSESHRALAQSEHSRPDGAKHVANAEQPDAEEFPIESSGRVRRRNTRASKQLASSAVASPTATSAPGPTPEQTAVEYHLSETDPIERAPSIDQTNANRLRRIGILRVGDLLRVPAAEVTADLRQLGISNEMVQSWQSQVRLMCRVRGLGSYDARILAACGITDAEQLFKLNATALRARVREFSATAEGQAILLSGTESELSRVTDWIQKRLLRNETAPHSGEIANSDSGARPERSLNAA